MKPRLRSQQQGLGLVTVAVVLVVLAALAAAVVRLGAAGQLSANDELLAMRAEQAARAAAQWGMYQALKGSWTACANASQTLDLSADYGMTATVSCASTQYNEGVDPASPTQPLTVRIYTISAMACNASSCPDNTRAQQPSYVERVFTVRLTN